MAVFLVTRHPGAREWARRQGLDAQPVTHLDAEAVGRSDTIIGTLPAHIVAALCERGARYLHLALDLPAHARGRELTAEDMECFGARLVQIEAHVVGEYTVPLNSDPTPPST